MKFLPSILLIPCMLLASGCLETFQPDYSAGTNLKPEYGGSAAPAGQPDVLAEQPAPQSAWHKTVWYIPNRLLDVIDIFRVRVRVGPGLAANVRITDYADLYAGQYYTYYVGLPGPRMGKELGWFAGYEQEKGLKVLGVDASDDMDDEADYSPTEFNLGAQLLILGLEIGFDPVELGDFLAGLITIDLRGDDW